MMDETIDEQCEQLKSENESVQLEACRKILELVLARESAGLEARIAALEKAALKRRQRRTTP
jgi:hypothetical protein